MYATQFGEGRALEDKPPLTPDEINEWQNLYRKSAAPATTPETTGGK